MIPRIWLWLWIGIFFTTFGVQMGISWYLAIKLRYYEEMNKLLEQELEKWHTSGGSDVKIRDF